MGGSFSKKKSKTTGTATADTNGKGKHDNNKHQTNGHDDGPVSKANGTGSKTPTSDTKSTPSQTDESDVGDDIVRGSKQKVSAEDFELLCVIGRGSFGKVMQVKYKENGQIYAMKVMRKAAIIAKNQVTHTKDEKSILQKIIHPFIVQLHFAFQTKDKLYMILDFVNGGELFYHLKKEGKFDEERVKFYAAEIASALLHLHKQGIIYRDLKPENILVDKDGHIVITDFGLSKEVPKDEGTNTFCGTPEYLAPEVLKGQGHSWPVDWWSLGTLIYEMLTGLPPYYSKNVHVMYQKIMNSPLTFPSSMSPDAQSLIKGLLTRDPDQRLGGEAVKAHPFFSDIDWHKLEQRAIAAPWIPPVRSETDVSQIDDNFKAEEAVDSIQAPGVLKDLDEDDMDVFKGFTFAGDKTLE